jgi:chemotaxis signal transduction protein
LSVAPGQRAAIGERELYHLIHAPKVHTVPSTPRHCSRVVLWEEQILPLWDLAAWLSGTPPVEVVPVVAVVAYQRSRRERPEFGTLALAAPPVRLAVRNEQACGLPEAMPAWKALAISCFAHQGQPIPIIDLARMFSGALASGRVDEQIEVPELAIVGA